MHLCKFKVSTLVLYSSKFLEITKFTNNTKTIINNIQKL